MVKHLATDWLAGTWFLYWANVFVTVVSILFFIVACAVGAPEPIFIWLSGLVACYFLLLSYIVVVYRSVVSTLFLIGSAYFVAGMILRYMEKRFNRSYL
jgi:hypothetical protein